MGTLGYCGAHPECRLPLVTQILSFDDVLDSTSGDLRLLLGNGFSMAWNAETFAYANLRERASFKGLSCDPDDLFEALSTSDFEVVIDRLEAAHTIASLYSPDSAVAEQAKQDAKIVKDALAGALAASHPDNVGRLTSDAYANVRRFLAHFNCVLSLNYDLLLYWAAMQDPTDGQDVPKGDGFRDDPDEPGAPWVTWDMAKSWGQQIHYLHGALHLFDAGDRLKKLTWRRTDRPVVDQVRELLDRGIYPLVVTEGSSLDKKDKILHSAYLSKAMRSFLEFQGDLVIYGIAMSPSDDHVLEALVRGKFSRIFVSVYGDPTSEDNRQLIERASLLPEQRDDYVKSFDKHRRKARTLEVRFFDAASARVWE